MKHILLLFNKIKTNLNMKILKLKSSFFSLLVIAMATVFLSSCQEDVLVPETAAISDAELVNQIFDAVGHEMDFTADNINTDSKFDIILNESHLDQSIIEALSNENIELDKKLILQNSQELLCSTFDDCPTRGDVEIQKLESTLSDRGFSIKISIGKTASGYSVSITIKFK